MYNHIYPSRFYCTYLFLTIFEILSPIVRGLPFPPKSCIQIENIVFHENSILKKGEGEGCLIQIVAMWSTVASQSPQVLVLFSNF